MIYQGDDKHILNGYEKLFFFYTVVFFLIHKRLKNKARKI